MNFFDEVMNIRTAASQVYIQCSSTLDGTFDAETARSIDARHTLNLLQQKLYKLFILAGNNPAGRVHIRMVRAYINALQDAINDAEADALYQQHKDTIDNFPDELL